MVLELSQSDLPACPAADATDTAVDFEQAFVQGRFLYYHYVIDGVNDPGWGCGYRTLQTLCSWLRLNGHGSSHPEPSLHQIQQALVACGDKPAWFVGSREWIGTNEALYVVDSVHQVPCRVFSFQTGKDLHQQQAQITLFQHLTETGSPIMCGGTRDNISRAIIGMRLCRADPSKTLYLILDPHYVHGPTNDMSNDESKSKAEHLQDLNTKGWLAWKPISSFSPSSYYNLMAPVPQYKSNAAIVASTASGAEPGAAGIELVDSGEAGSSSAGSGIVLVESGEEASP